MSTDDNSATVAAPQAEPSVSVEAPVPLRQHSNENLLKIDTFDRFSTASAVKKHIAKVLGAKVNAEAQPMFKGMKRMNKNPKTQYLFMAFETEEDQRAALDLLLQVSYRGNAWKSVPVTEHDLSLTHKGGVKRPRDDGNDGDSSKLTQYEKYPIEQQLEMKKAHCLKVMKAIVPGRAFGWDAYSKRFVGIVESPQLTGYRNHVNLSFGLTPAGAPSLGFMTGSLVEGRSTIESAVEPDKDVLTMNVAAKVVAVAVMQVFGEFVASGLGVFDKVVGSGFWRRLQVRHNTKAEVMVDLEVDEDSAPPEVFAQVKTRLVAALAGEELTQRLRQSTGRDSAGVVSVQYHKHSGTTSISPEAPRVVLHGASTLTETLAGLEYELSPTAFFQVNTPGMERMLERVHEVADLSPTTTLLDLCSGTGTIGLTLARYVKRVIGIELVESAVQNARRNAEHNKIANATFHCGRVENMLPGVISALSAEDKADIVAILDPPRAGVNATVLKWIRGTPTIRKVVYISCEQRALERDCPGLAKPCTKAYRGIPFEVTAGFAVDLFPHTHHVEMVAVLNRRAGAAEGEPEKENSGPDEANEAEANDAQSDAHDGGDCGGASH